MADVTVKKEAGVVEAVSDEILKLIETYPDGLDKDVSAYFVSYSLGAGGHDTVN